jgi:hypothetical protein
MEISSIDLYILSNEVEMLSEKTLLFFMLCMILLQVMMCEGTLIFGSFFFIVFYQSFFLTYFHFFGLAFYCLFSFFRIGFCFYRLLFSLFFFDIVLFLFLWLM